MGNSGLSTPLPADAPPSSQSISSARQQIRAQNKQRLFPTIEYAARVSHFDRESDHRDFRGFFVLFWIGLAFMVITTMLRNIKDTGYPMRIKIWSLFTENTWQMALSDLAMVASTAVSLPLHRMFRSKNRLLQWHWGGMVIQSIYQVVWLVFWITYVDYLVTDISRVNSIFESMLIWSRWPFIFGWAWTAQVFLTLHTLTLLMKMHSYAFYNGHLSSVQRQLLELDNPMTTPTSPTYKYPSSGASLRKDEKEMLGGKGDDDDNPIDSLREDLALELTSPLGRVTYPQNLTLWNYIDYLLCPTLCYELEYPRTEKIRWMELTGKVLAVFGCIFLLTIISEEFIVPVMIESATRLEQAECLFESALILAEGISLLLFPFTVIILLVFLVIFEYILGAFAEITCESYPGHCLALPSHVNHLLIQALRTAISIAIGGSKLFLIYQRNRF